MSVPRLADLLDHYQGRISSPGVTEDSGGRFDIPLVVDGVEIACVNLRSRGVVQLYRNGAGEPAALAADGSVVPLP